MRKLLALVLLAAAPLPALAQPVPTPTIAPLGPNSALLSLTAEGQSRRTPDLASVQRRRRDARAAPPPRRSPRTAGGWTR